MINRDVEEALHLLRVQIHGEHSAHARRVQQVGDQLGRDRDARLIFTILAGISKKWNDRCNPIRACAPRRVHHDEQLHQVDAARRASADRITAVIPFFGYARQDRKDQPRVPITAKLVANLLYAAGVSRVLTMDLHAQQVQGFFDIPVDHLYSLPVLIKYLRKRLTGKTTVVSPDLGGLKMASAYAEALGANLAIVAKERKSA